MQGPLPDPEHQVVLSLHMSGPLCIIHPTGICGIQRVEAERTVGGCRNALWRPSMEFALWSLLKLGFSTRKQKSFALDWPAARPLFIANNNKSRKNKEFDLRAGYKASLGHSSKWFNWLASLIRKTNFILTYALLCKFTIGFRKCIFCLIIKQSFMNLKHKWLELQRFDSLSVGRRNGNKWTAPNSFKLRK